MIKRFIEWIVEHPARRTWCLSALTILTSAAIAALIRTIAQGSQIDWSSAWSSVYLYLLIVIYVFYAAIQTAAFQYDKKVAKSISKNNPYKYVVQECLPAYAEYCKHLLAEGKIAEYHKVTEQLRGKEKLK